MANAIKNITILRPGALGDVLVCRHLLRSLKTAFPEARLTFVAPGERGKLFGRFGLADAAMDWESAAFAWLFGKDESAPPEVLRALFALGTLVLAYLDLGEEEERNFRERISVINPGLSLFLSPSRPADGTGMYIGEWLIRNAALHCQTLCAQPIDLAGSGADLISDADADDVTLVIHPGSGSAKKNWPIQSFAALAGLLTAESAGTGLKRIRITVGEADTGLGEKLTEFLPKAELIEQPDLAELAKILASAGLYLGNDSGVTHLAAAVKTLGGRKPKVAAVFGPSDPGIWVAPGILALKAGREMDELPPEAAFRAVCKTFFPALALTNPEQS